MRGTMARFPLRYFGVLALGFLPVLLFKAKMTERAVQLDNILAPLESTLELTYGLVQLPSRSQCHRSRQAGSAGNKPIVAPFIDLLIVDPSGEAATRRLHSNSIVAA